MRNHICLITLYVFTYILYSCSIDQEYDSFNIIPQFGITECLIQYKCSENTPPPYAIRSG